MKTGDELKGLDEETFRAHNLNTGRWLPEMTNYAEKTGEISQIWPQLGAIVLKFPDGISWMYPRAAYKNQI